MPDKAVANMEFLARKAGITREQVDLFLQTIVDVLAAGYDVELRGFGTFHVRPRRARVRPTTGIAGGEMHVKAGQTARFKAATRFRKEVNRDADE